MVKDIGWPCLHSACLSRSHHLHEDTASILSLVGSSLLSPRFTITPFVNTVLCVDNVSSTVDPWPSFTSPYQDRTMFSFSHKYSLVHISQHTDLQCSIMIECQITTFNIRTMGWGKRCTVWIKKRVWWQKLFRRKVECHVQKLIQLRVTRDNLTRVPKLSNNNLFVSYLLLSLKVWLPQCSPCKVFGM